jgi:hypothetical protein
MAKATKKTLPINTVSYEIIKDYCREGNLKISGWAEAVLIKVIEDEKKSTNKKVL